MKIIIVNAEQQFRLIPDSALLLKNRPFFRPDYVQDLHVKIALVVKINRLGKYIQEKFASTYYDEIGFAINFYDKTCLENQMQTGLPWERATCFDGSFALSEFVKISEILNPVETQGLASLHNDHSQIFAIKSTFQQIPKIISELSTYMTLKIGDYIAFELSEWPTRMAINDVLKLSVNDNQLINVVVK